MQNDHTEDCPRCGGTVTIPEWVSEDQELVCDDCGLVAVVRLADEPEEAGCSLWLEAPEEDEEI